MHYILTHPGSGCQVRLTGHDERDIMQYALQGYHNATLEQMSDEMKERTYAGRSRRSWVKLGAPVRPQQSPRRRRSSSARRRRRVRHGRYL